jgi:hypothetical protein
VAKAAADGDGGHAGAEIQGIATTAMSASSTSRAGFLFLAGSLKFELWYWIRSKKLDGIVYIHIKSIWKLAWAKWDRVYQATVFRYYM